MSNSDIENINESHAEGEDNRKSVTCESDTCVFWSSPNVCGADDISIVKTSYGHCVCGTYKPKS